MNIEDLTIKQLRELSAFMPALSTQPAPPNTLESHGVGKKVIVRTYSSGVHYGIMRQRCGNEALLDECRRIHYWKGAFTLTEISNSGLGEGSKLSEPKNGFLTIGVIEILPCSDDAIKSLDNILPFEV